MFSLFIELDGQVIYGDGSPEQDDLPFARAAMDRNFKRGAQIEQKRHRRNFARVVKHMREVYPPSSKER